MSGQVATPPTTARSITAKSHVDNRTEDPNFLMCMALCYVGIPPGLWRMIVRFMLEAYSAEYRTILGEVRGSKEFEEFRLTFKGWSTFNKLKFVINFLLGEVRFGPLVLKTTAGRGARDRALATLARAGVRQGSLTAASQILRKVTVVLELAWMTGCAGYCGGLACANVVVSFSVAAVSAVTEFGGIAGQAAHAVAAQVFIRPLHVARAMMNPSNWDTTPLGKSALALRLLGEFLWPKLQSNDADTFLANLNKPLSSFNIPPAAVLEIATAMADTVNARREFLQQITCTPDAILECNPLSFVVTLSEWKLLRFIRDPAGVADEALGGRL